MLLYGTSHSLEFIPSDCIVFNHSGYIENIPDVKLLPPNFLGSNSEYDFDVKYFGYVMNSDVVFLELMKIIMNLYEGGNVFLVISNDEWSTILIESLLKLIQQRYGINATRIDSEEDLLYAEESDFEPGYGLFNLDQDKDRWSYLYASTHKKEMGIKED